MIGLVDTLPTLSHTQRTAILTSPRTARDHRRLMRDVTAMTSVEVGGESARTALTWPVSVVAWNVERCLFPQATADQVRSLSPHVVLLSEVDNGMARTQQRHTTADIAAALGMRYAYAVEFIEMGLGGDGERAFCSDDFNAKGWHGNAILSHAPFERLHLIRLDDNGHWFVPGQGAADPGQPRVGGRMAIAAQIKVHDQTVCFVSTHLESAADTAHRDRQMTVLLDAIDAFAPGLPVIVGGDLNTGNHLPTYDWREETLFETARKRGYHWDANADGPTTRPSLITRNPAATMKLDWFAARELTGSNARIVPSLDQTGRPLSDHDAVAAHFHP